jgi:hypothetical protein
MKHKHNSLNSYLLHDYYKTVVKQPRILHKGSFIVKGKT